jgi:putative ABC transport system substrate-binding protein
MRRRDFVTGLVGTALIPPHVAFAQPAAVPIVGFLDSRRSTEAVPANLAAFHRGLSEAGYVDGRNVVIEYRWADDHDEQLPKLAADLVHRNVAVIVTPSSSLAARAAQRATTSIPIVFGIGTDPFKLGLVQRFNRPGGNITGFVRQSHEIAQKRLEILHTIVPHSNLVAVLVNPANPASKEDTNELNEAARILGLRLAILQASSRGEIESAFARVTEQGYPALFVSSDNFFSASRKYITALAAQHAVPAIYAYRFYTEASGLISYGPEATDGHRQIGIYVGRILKGEKPADLPVMQPTKFELVINLKTAKALGIAVPPTVLALADEVIE